MRLDLVVAAGLEDAAAIWQRFEQDRGVGTKRGDEASLDAFDVDGDRLFAEVVLGQLARFANAEPALIVRDAILDEAERTRRGGDAVGEFTAGIVGDHPLKMIRGERGEFGHADAVFVEGIPEEGSEVAHMLMRLRIRAVKANTRIEEAEIETGHGSRECRLILILRARFAKNERLRPHISEVCRSV